MPPQSSAPLQLVRIPGKPRGFPEALGKSDSLPAIRKKCLQLETLQKPFSTLFNFWAWMAQMTLVAH